MLGLGATYLIKIDPQKTIPVGNLIIPITYSIHSTSDAP